jgi:hypothetical protein
MQEAQATPETNTPQNLPQIQTVSKTKSPGRIEAGKRLAEWNKQKKLELQQKVHVADPSQLPSQTQELKSETSITPPKHEQPAKHDLVSNYAVGLVAVAGLGYIGYSLLQKYSPKILTQTKNLVTQSIGRAATTSTKESRIDPFLMQ